MRAAAFIFSLLCFLLYLYNNRRPRHCRGREAATIPKEQPPATEAQFFRERIKALETMRARAIAEENTAAAALAHDENMNSFGAVVNERTLKRKRAELYTAQRKRLAIETQLHKARQGLNKAIGGG